MAFLDYFKIIKLIQKPVTVAARSKAVFARSDAGIVGLNPTQDMYVCCLHAFESYCL
jgi:hypothetical protein